MEWIRTSEKLPEIRKRVLAFTDVREIRVLFLDDFAGTLMWTDLETPYLNIDEVSHWMELPQPPEGKTHA